MDKTITSINSKKFYTQDSKLTNKFQHVLNLLPQPVIFSSGHDKLVELASNNGSK